MTNSEEERAYYTRELESRIRDIPLKPLDGETRGIIWLDIAGKPAAQRLDQVLDENPKVGWVQLPQAGINNFAEVVKKHNRKVWTSAKVRA